MAVCLPLFLAQILFAQVRLPDSPQGKIVHAYVDAFNSGDDNKLRDFFLENVSKEGLAERPVEARMERIKSIRMDIKSLSVIKVLNVGESEINVTAKTGNNDFATLSFKFETGSHKFAGVGITMGEELPVGGPPMSKKEFLAKLSQDLVQRTREDKFSGAVLVQRGETVLIKKAFGLADKRFYVTNRTDTKFNIGSICKYFTRVAIGQLAESGKLFLDDKIIKYLPDYPNAAVAQKVTINQLLTMRSGMGDFFGVRFDDAAKDKINTLNDYMKFFVNDTLLFEPGTQRRYSNAGFIVLGLIVEKLSGKDYYSYMREHIFDPAGMNNTGWYPLSGLTPNLATGYTRPSDNDQTWISNIHMLPGRGSSAGGGYTTLDDMVLFIRALLNGKLLSPKYSQWVVTGDLPSTEPPLPLKHGGAGIAGGTAGVNASVEFDAASGDIVIVLANEDPPSAEDVGKTISGWLKRLDGTK